MDEDESVEHRHVLLVAAGEASSEEEPTDTAFIPSMIDDGTTESLQESCEIKFICFDYACCIVTYIVK